MKHAKSLISQADYYPKDGDQLWCVFDCDDNKDSELQAAISYSEKHGYKIAYSNPAFEYWYLLHFEKRNGYLKDSATIIDILKTKDIWKITEKVWMFLKNCRNTSQKLFSTQKNEWRD